MVYRWKSEGSPWHTLAIQAFICSLAVGVIRYGKMGKGLSFALPFMVVSATVYSVAQFIIRGMATSLAFYAEFLEIFVDRIA